MLEKKFRDIWVKDNIEDVQQNDEKEPEEMRYIQLKDNITDI